MRLPPGIVWPKWQSIRWMLVLHLAGRYVGSVTVFRPVSPAKRGVRVRLLLDDNNTPGLTTFYACLTAIPALKSGFLILLVSLAASAWLYHRLFPSQSRMHNKSFTVDGVVTLVGGRNLVMPILGQGKSHFFRI